MVVLQVIQVLHLTNWQLFPIMDTGDFSVVSELGCHLLSIAQGFR